LLTLYRVRTEPRFRISAEQVKDLATVMLLGVIIGGRLGYVIFYNPAYYLEHPLEIVLPFDFSNGIRFTGISGMSYHGGLIGVVLGAFVYVRRTGLSFREAADLFAPAVPLGYTFGRLGNFINGELYGRVTEAAIGMYFPLAPGPPAPASLPSCTRLFSKAFSCSGSCGLSGRNRCRKGP
jgi:phosphatidylglycerol:prolipoprotein diacylglycerol transferase